ncbi:lipid II flippase MurJ [Pseudonocardia sp. GCM10023141]|uniref:lipid II flippase MurJ n=1 Tax=Pseudonocardia sp. GCM10023141 TaxID=3252653 RepID=UPI0036092B60
MPDQPRFLETGRAMAVATVASRVTGFVRTVALVAALGLGTQLLDAYRLFQLPYAIIAVTVITGMLPRMSRAAAKRDPTATAHVLGPATGTAWTGTLLTVIAAAVVGAGFYALGAHAPRISELATVVSALRWSVP